MWVQLAGDVRERQDNENSLHTKMSVLTFTPYTYMDRYYTNIIKADIHLRVDSVLRCQV